MQGRLWRQYQRRIGVCVRLCQQATKSLGEVLRLLTSDGLGRWEDFGLPQ